METNMDYLIRVYENVPEGRLLMVLDEARDKNIISQLKGQNVRMVPEYYEPLSKIKFDKKFE